MVLNQEIRWKIIALLSNGSSRRIAERYVGVAPSTITRAANRDPEFAQQLAAAEQNAEIDALKSVRAAARNNRYWRAAAWLLERKNPQDFSRRPLDLLTPEEMQNLLQWLAMSIMKKLPAGKHRKILLKNLEQIIKELADPFIQNQFPPYKFLEPNQFTDCPELSG